MKAEIERRMSFTERVLRYFLAHPGEWISTQELEIEGGRCAWRTRVSNARKILEKQEIGTIENETRHFESGTVSRYRFVPYVKRLGPEAGTFRQARLL